MSKEDNIVVELDGKTYEASIYTDKAPFTCRAIRAQSPIRGDFFHAMWSGWLGLMLYELKNVPLENPHTYFSPGDLLYHPHHHEIGICYQATQFKEPHAAVFVNLFGRLHGDLTHLIQVGRRLQMTGARPLVIR
jgi:hypothetical protein